MFKKCILSNITIRFVTSIFLLIIISSIVSCKKDSNNSDGTTPPAPLTGGGILVSDNQRYLGVNYNEGLANLYAAEVNGSKTKWVRGFIDVFYHYDINNSTFDDAGRLTSLFSNKSSGGYRVVLNLKFNFKTRSYPVVNSPEWNSYISFVDKILDKIIAQTDVIVVGNEPFIESEVNTWNEPLNSFYKALATRVNEYLKARNIQRPIFLGAFDNMYQNGRQGNAGINNMLNWCKATSWIAGIDLHIHHTTNDEITTALNFIDDKVRPDQKIIITEYSLMKWWRDNLTQDISLTFLNKANENAADNILPPPAAITKVWQYIDYALNNPRHIDEWNAFHQYTPWLESRSDYMCSSLRLFKANTKFWLATYAVRQSYPVGAAFTATTDPWILNSLYVSRTVPLTLSGLVLAQPRYGFFNQFADINTSNTTCP